MCGITGFYDANSKLEQSMHLLESMTKLLSHRGPDCDGFWSHNNVFFGHRRLSIQDLSSNGNQPMVSSNNSYVIIFNGEIYNHLILRNESDYLKNKDFKSTSDTETLLELIQEAGIDKALSLVDGMFAFCLFSIKENMLYLARDRMGEKPLFYYENKNQFIFASELKSILIYPNLNKTIDEFSARNFFSSGYISNPNSIYKFIKKVNPASYIKYDIQINKIKEEIYWDIDNIVNNSKNKYSQLSSNEAEELFEYHFKNSVNNQLISDVPVGSFLSGGIDSSLIAKMLSKNNDKQKITTFTVGFEDKNLDESSYAKEVSKVFGLKNKILNINLDNISNDIEKILDNFDEPFSDSSQIPTYYISKLASQHVKVILSGDGGDELFGGYNRYTEGPYLWNIFNKIPAQLRNIIYHSSNLISPSSFENFIYLNKNFFKKLSKISLLGQKYEKILRILNSKDAPSFHKNILFRNKLKIDYQIDDFYFKKNNNQLKLEEMMMLYDIKTYLPNDILTKVDRSSMAHSLETRSPFLGKEVIEFALGLSIEHKINKRNGKKILKESLFKGIDKSLFDRPKAGFAAPMPKWIRENLKPFVGDMVNNKKLYDFDFIDKSYVNKLFNDHIKLKADNSEVLWDISVFSNWLIKQEDH